MTAQVIQKAEILGIKGSTIRIKHPNISKYPLTYVNSSFSAAGASLSVYDNARYADNDWFILGSVGDKQTEECDVADTVARGQTLTITGSTKFDHEIDTPVRKIFERGIRIYGSDTDGVAGTIIESIDAIASPIADATMVDWTQEYTEYTLISTDTTYAFYYVVFTDGTTDGLASDYVAAGGENAAALENLIQSALDLTDARIGESKITYPFLIRQADRCQDYIKNFAFQNRPSGRMVMKNWSFELTNGTLTTSENENVYALSGLSTTIKRSSTPDSILNLRIGSEEPLDQINIQDMRNDLALHPTTTVASDITAGDTTITLTDTNDFDDSGSIYVVGQTEAVTYTSKNDSTGVLSGVPATGNSGAVTSTTALEATSVWQSLSPGLPTKYAVYAGNVILNRPVGSDYAGQKLKIDYFKLLDRLTEVSDVTQVTFYNIFELWLASKIETKKGNKTDAADYMKQFNDILFQNAKADKTPNVDHTNRYNFGDPNTFR